MNKFISQMEPWIGKEERKAVDSYLHSGGWLTEFKKTKQFEDSIANFVGSKYASVVANGTVSLFIALLALEIGKGDEVLVPNLTMIASANAVLLAESKPVLVDIDPQTLCLDLVKAQEALTKKTKAMMFVSLNGRSSNMKEVVNFCKKNKIFLIEDAAQSMGSKWNEKHLGTFGEIGSFSFSAPKIITTGQGGALVTDSKKLIERIRRIKDFGRRKSGIDEHVTLGYNFKFTDILAVIGIEQMKKLTRRVKRKKEIFAQYQDELSKIKEVQFVETNLEDTSPWFIDVLVKNRKKLVEYLRKKNIGTRPFYPPVHSQAPYKNWTEYKKRRFSISEDISTRGLWLPSSSFLTNSDIMRISKEIKNFYGEN